MHLNLIQMHLHLIQLLRICICTCIWFNCCAFAFALAFDSTAVHLHLHLHLIRLLHLHLNAPARIWAQACYMVLVDYSALLKPLPPCFPTSHPPISPSLPSVPPSDYPAFPEYLQCNRSGKCSPNILFKTWCLVTLKCGPIKLPLVGWGEGDKKNVSIFSTVHDISQTSTFLTP